MSRGCCVEGVVEGLLCRGVAMLRGWCVERGGVLRGWHVVGVVCCGGR